MASLVTRWAKVSRKSLPLCALRAQSDDFDGSQRDRAEEATGQQRSFLKVVPLGGEGLSTRLGAGLVAQEPLRPTFELGSVPAHVIGELLVSDEAVSPEIGNVDFQGVCSGFGEIGDVDSEGRLPKGCDGFAIEADSAEFAYVA